MLDIKFPVEIGPYEISVENSSIFAEKYNDHLLYRITNKLSGVVEGEAFSLPRAMLQARASTLSIERLLSDNLHDAEIMSMETMFDELEEDSEIKTTH